MCNVSRELPHPLRQDRPAQTQGGQGERVPLLFAAGKLYLFDVIRFFSDTGMSMKEIKQYLDNRTTQLFLGCAQESIEKMERQRDVLDARISMMEKMRYITQRALTFPKDKPCLSYWDETWFAATDVPRERTQQAYAEAFSAHTDFCRNTIGVTGFPLGRIVDIPDLTRPDDFYYTKLLTVDQPAGVPGALGRPRDTQAEGQLCGYSPPGRHQHGRGLLREAAAVREEGRARPVRAGARVGHELLSHVGLGRGLPAAHLGPRGGLTRGWSGGPRRAGHRTSRRGAGGYAGADGRAPA